MIRPGLVSVTFRKLAPREIVSLAVLCGPGGIEWGGDVHVRDAETAREVRTMTEDAGLVVAAFGSYWRAEGEFGPTLEIATSLGASNVRVWAGTQGSTEHGERERVADAVRAACETASGAGMTISLEHHGGTLTDTLDSTLKLVKEVSHPALRLYWQPFPERTHAQRLREVRALLPHLSNLHVFQWTKSQGDVLRHALGTGEEEWPEILRNVPGDRFALLEFLPNDDPDVLPREAGTLRRWLADLSQTEEGRSQRRGWCESRCP